MNIEELEKIIGKRPVYLDYDFSVARRQKYEAELLQWEIKSREYESAKADRLQKILDNCEGGRLDICCADYNE